MTSDAADLTAAQAGDREALTRLYDRHAGLLLSLCRRWTAWADAEDAVQETFVRAIRRIEDVEQSGSIRSWLCTIARRVCSEHRRSLHRRVRRETEVAVQNALSTPTLDPEADPGRAEELARLTLALDLLPDRERLAIHLYYLEPDPHATASTLMGLTRSGFHKLLARARDQLAAAMREVSV